jgi:IclR family pca regulon transcriptional regulator
MPKPSTKPAIKKTAAKRPPEPIGTDKAAAEKKALSIAEEIDALTGDPSFMTSFARGLAVVRAFSDQRRSLTIAQISHKTGIPRAAVRRCLHTLRQLGYADSESNNFSLKPKILTLGYSYLSSTPLTVSAQPYLDHISRTLKESCSMAVLDGQDILYVSRASTSRIMSVALNVGSRLPAYCTSLGRVMLAAMSDEALKAYFNAIELRAYTERTVVSVKRLKEILSGIREAGYAIVEEELEIGLRSIAVPIRGAAGTVVAALNVGAQATRVSARQMEEEFLPVLLNGSRELSALLP